MLTLKSKNVKFSTGGPLIAILNHVDAKKLDAQALDRIKIKHGRKEIVAAVDISESKDIQPGQIGLFKELVKELEIKKQTKLKVLPTTIPRSVDYIKKKLDKKELTKKEIDTIIKDLVENELTEIELTYFVSACYLNGLNDKETKYLTEAVVRHGEKLDIHRKVMVDKHCIGGIPNNRTTMLLVPIISAAGLTMIKTSSRSITSPAGTADTMESLANIEFDSEKINKIVKESDGCIVWGGAVDLAAADEKLIKVRHPLRLDPEGMMLASILAKKVAVNSTHLLIDIPLGKTAKITDKKQAKHLKNHFEKLGKQLHIKTKVIITDGSQPIGNGIGPNLEARDILYILRKNPKAPKDLEKKSIYMADLLFKITKTKASAREILNSGKAYTQFMKIIESQEGNGKIKPADLKLGKFQHKVKSTRSGRISEIDNKLISKIARLAGAPDDKEAGIYLNIKLKDKVKKGQILMTIYSNSKDKLNNTKEFLKDSIIIK
jgi:putative thymidine phosphorylase